MDYRTAKTIRGKSLSSLITQKIRSGGGATSSIRSSISEKIKAKGVGIKEKFDPLNIAKFMTGGGNLAPAILGRITGRKQEDINYFSGGRQTLTQIKKTKPLGQVSGETSDSIVAIFNLIKKNHERDLQLRETERSFQEEKANEEQRRHGEFLKILKDYTSEGTAVAVKTGSSGGILDFLGTVKTMIADAVKNTIETIQNMFSWLNDLRKSELFKFLGSKLFALLTSGPFLAVASAGALLLLLANDKNPEQTTKQMLGAADPNAIGAAIDKQQQENVSSEELNKKFEVRRALLKDAPLKTKYLGIGQREYLQQIGVPENQVEQLYDDTKPLVVPEVLKNVDPQLYNRLKPSTKPVSNNRTPSVGVVADKGINSTAPSNPISSVTMKDTAEQTQTPKATVVPSAPASSPVSDAIEENVSLNMSSSMSPASTTAPIITNNVNSTSTEESIPTTATVRDRNVAIVNRVFEQSESYI